MSYETTLVFVYGSLRRGEQNHWHLDGCLLIREARTEPGFRLYDLGAYPAMVAGGRGSVVGEVYAVGPEALAALDRLEGHPRYYQRQVVRLADGQAVESYLMQESKVDGRRLVPHGDWSKRGSARVRAAVLGTARSDR